jgi:DNA-binding beta-propeller fold protein YncE
MRGKSIAIFGLAVGSLFAVFSGAIPAWPGPSGYHILKTIHLPGTEGWDYLTMDSAARILYISRENHIDAVNIDTGAMAGKVTGLDGTNGLLPVPELGRGFATNEGKSEVVIVDLKTLQKIGTVKTGKAPDSFAYEPVTRRVFIMNSAGASTTAISAPEGAVVGTVPLGGQPEFVVADGKGSLFINITDKNEVVEVDGKALKVLHRWPLAPGEGPSGISMDRKNRRLFSVCDNQKMIVMNADTGKVVAALRTGAGTDASVFDPDTMNAFAPAGGAGTLTIIHEDSPDKFSVLEEIDTQSGARTATLDTKTHDVITVAARHGHGSTHNDVLADTFVVLVIGK